MRLPEAWPRRARSAIVHAVSMARTAFVVAHTHAEHHAHPRARLQARHDRLEREVALLREELRIKDARMEKLTASADPTTRRRSGSGFWSCGLHEDGRSPIRPGTCS
jgi:hypothetical protein